MYLPNPYKMYDTIKKTIFKNESRQITNTVYILPKNNYNDIDNISSYSSISYETQDIDKKDLQSICIQDDIDELKTVTIEQTIPFAPCLQYGKVLKVINSREIILASRIYNGYTKITKPKLYNFNITLNDIPYFGVLDNIMKEKLTSLILNKIVIICNIKIDTESNITFANIYLNNIYINEHLIHVYNDIIDNK